MTLESGLLKAIPPHGPELYPILLGLQHPRQFFDSRILVEANHIAGGVACT